MKNKYFITTLCCLMAVFFVSCTKNSSQPSEGPDVKHSEPGIINESKSKPMNDFKENDLDHTPSGDKQSPKQVLETRPKELKDETIQKSSNKTKENKKNSIEKDFKEIIELPSNLVNAIDFEAVKYYQNGEMIYLLTPSALKDEKSAEVLRKIPEGSSSEVWTYNTRTGELLKLFVKYDYDFGNLRQNNGYGIPRGRIYTIDKVDINGNVIFTERWGEGMGHYGTRTFEYVYREGIIKTLSVESSKRLLTQEEIKEVENEIFTKDILKMFHQISDIIETDNYRSNFQSFANGNLYAVKYNIQNEEGKIYHEIGSFEVKSGLYTPLIRKMLTEKDTDPFIIVKNVDIKNNLTVHEAIYESSIPIYFYNAERNKITLQSGSEKTGMYVVIPR